MNARNTAKRIAAILFIVAGACGSAVFANPVHIYSRDFDLPILDEPGPGISMTEAIIEIPDHLIIDDLDVGLTLTHTNVFDLQIFLLSPAGTRICLNMYDFRNEFSVYPNYTNTIFDDEAAISIKRGDAPFTGRFRPVEPYELSEFDGEQSIGQWRLQIYDMFDSDSGTLNHFELIVTAPEPATVVLLTLGSVLSALLRPGQRSL